MIGQMELSPILSFNVLNKFNSVQIQVDLNKVI